MTVCVSSENEEETLLSGDFFAVTPFFQKALASPGNTFVPVRRDDPAIGPKVAEIFADCTPTQQKTDLIKKAESEGPR